MKRVNRAIKKVQRKVNKEIADFNKELVKDNLWRGRFQIRQVGRYAQRYEDGSGFDIHFDFAIVDKKSGKYIVVRINQYGVLKSWRLWNEVNNFIIHDIAVWEECPNPRDKDFVVDYSNKPLELKENLKFRWS